MRTAHRTPSHGVFRRRGIGLVQAVVSVSTVVTLITTIMVPALVGLQGRNRQAVCTTRIGLLTRAMLVYASDYDETPPFLGIGYGSAFTKTYPALDPDPAHNEGWFLNQETWLLPNLVTWSLDGDWTEDVPAPNVADGTLFPYTRNPVLYRCPEFERIPTGTQSTLAGQPWATKSQNLFNYTRTLFGRKVISAVLGDPNAPDTLAPGPIVKLSAVHAPARLFMVLDEQWDYHCAAGYRYKNYGNLLTGNGWTSMAAECIHAIVGDAIGSYHGTMGKVIPYHFMIPSMKGNVAYYDGHVSLYADPWPWRSTVSSGYILDFLSQLAADYNSNPQGPAVKIVDPQLQSIYAQRGIWLDLATYLQLPA